MHPVNLSIQKIEDTVDLQPLTFLMTSFEDCPKVGISPALENMCIAESFQAKRELLAAPCLISGRVVSAAPPELVIQESTGKETMTLIISSNLVANTKGGVNALNKLQGQWVRILCLFWYGHSTGARATLRPEAQMIEPIDEQSEAMLDDFIGYVRLRGRVPRTELSARYPKVEPGSCSPPVSWNQETVSWLVTPLSGDGVVKAFDSEADRIRSLRAGESTVSSAYLSSMLHELDRPKLRADGLAEFLGQDEGLRNSLLLLVSEEDRLGSLGQRRKDLIRTLGEADGRAPGVAAWMRDVGLIWRQPTGLMISPMGKMVAVSISREAVTKSVSDFVRANDVVFSTVRICEAIRWPPTLVVPELESLRKAGRLECASVMGRRFPLVWIGGSIDATKRENAQKLASSFLATVQSTMTGYNGLSQSKLVELISTSQHFDNFSAEVILRELQQEGKVELEIEPGGTKMWSYPRKNRVLDVLTANPGRLFKLRELATLAGVPLADSIEVYSILRDLERRQAVSEVKEDTWTVGTGPAVFDRILYYHGSEFVRSDIKQRGGSIRYVWLTADLLNALQAWVPEYGKNWGIKWSASAAREKAEFILYRMISDGELERDGDTCRLAVVNRS
jgi:hypothetical protein